MYYYYQYVYTVYQRLLSYQQQSVAYKKKFATQVYVRIQNILYYVLIILCIPVGYTYYVYVQQFTKCMYVYMYNTIQTPFSTIMLVLTKVLCRYMSCIIRFFVHMLECIELLLPCCKCWFVHLYQSVGNPVFMLINIIILECQCPYLNTLV